MKATIIWSVVVLSLTLWSLVTIWDLEERLSRVETLSSLLMAGYQNERKVKEYREAIARGETAP